MKAIAIRLNPALREALASPCSAHALFARQAYVVPLPIQCMTASQIEPDVVFAIGFIVTSWVPRKDFELPLTA